MKHIKFDLLIKYENNELEDKTRERVETHIKECDECKAKLNFYRGTVESLGEYNESSSAEIEFPSIQITDELRERIEQMGSTTWYYRLWGRITEGISSIHWKPYIYGWASAILLIAPVVILYFHTTRVKEAVPKEAVPKEAVPKDGSEYSSQFAYDGLVMDIVGDKVITNVHKDVEVGQRLEVLGKVATLEITSIDAGFSKAIIVSQDKSEGVKKSDFVKIFTPSKGNLKSNNFDDAGGKSTLAKSSPINPTTRIIPPDAQNTFAVIIGIEKYPSLPKDKQLNFAVDDAEAMKEVFVKRGGIPPQNIKLLLNAEATKKAIEESMRIWLNNKLEGKPYQSATIIIYYSGHGGRIEDLDGDETDGYDEVLLPYYKPDKTDENKITSLIIDDEFGWWLSQVKAKQKISIFDCCYAGGAERDKGVNLTVVTTKQGANYPSRKENPLTKDIRLPDTIVMSACNSEEKAKERKGLKHGVFTYYLLEALEGKADYGDNSMLSVQEAFQYAAERVEGQTPVLTPDESPLKDVCLLEDKWRVLRVSDSEIVIALTNSNGIENNDRLRVVRRDKVIELRSGVEPIGKKEIAVIEVTDVQDQLSYAKLVEGQKPKVGDKLKKKKDGHLIAILTTPEVQEKEGRPPLLTVDYDSSDEKASGTIHDLVNSKDYTVIVYVYTDKWHMRPDASENSYATIAKKIDDDYLSWSVEYVDKGDKILALLVQREAFEAYRAETDPEDKYNRKKNKINPLKEEEMKRLKDNKDVVVIWAEKKIQ